MNHPYAELEQLIDERRIQSISADLVPAAPGARYPGMHLFINALYSPEIVELPPEECLKCMRQDMIRVLQATVSESWALEARGLVITFYHIFRQEKDPTLPRSWRRRAYRYAILREGIEVDPALITEEYLVSSPVSQESSQLDRIQQLIERNPYYDPHRWE